MSESIRSDKNGLGEHKVKAVQCGDDMVMIFLEGGLLSSSIAISLDAASKLAEQIKSAVVAARSESLKVAA